MSDRTYKQVISPKYKPKRTSDESKHSFTFEKPQTLNQRTSYPIDQNDTNEASTNQRSNNYLLLQDQSKYKFFQPKD